jgi:ADP-ribose pyrophosphatase
MSKTTQEPQILSISDLPTSEAKWVALKKVEFVDQKGTPRSWEIAVRKTTSKSGVDAVAMGNIFVHPTKPPATLLVIQYRPPVGKYTVEWPAGLIDEHETPEEAAIREMKEETGYEGRILDSSPAVAADPGLTNATLKLVMMEVQLSGGEADEIMPDQKLDDGELIERVMVPLAELYERLLGWAARDDFMVAAKLFHFAAGVHFAKTSGYI